MSKIEPANGMIIIHNILKNHATDEHRVIDSITLDYDQRYCRRCRLSTTKGMDIIIDLKKACLLEDGDYLVTDDGQSIKVIAAKEQVLDIYPGIEANLACIAWHIGNRHCPMQLFSDHLRIRYDHVLEHMVQGLGATTHTVMASFSPLQGAYSHEHKHS